MAKTLIFSSLLGGPIFFREFYLYQLDIVHSNHPMQFKGKLMDQIWENGKKPNFGSNFGWFGPNVDPQNLFCGFYLYQQLDFVPNYHPMQFPVAKNLILCSILQCLPQIWAPIFLFVGFTSTSTQTLIHPIILGKFNGKLMNQTREMAKKTNFGPGFGQFGTNFNQNFFCGCYIHQILTIVSNFHCMQFQGKLRNQTCEMTKKTQFQARFWPLRPKLGLPNVFKKNLAQSVTTYHGQL